MIIGIDFDNTLAGYDRLFADLATSQNIVTTNATKQTIRNVVRTLPNGETKWRRMQAIAYGERMAEASLMEGAGQFLLECHNRKILVHIISHKTEFAAEDLLGINLRSAAMAWMETHRFFAENGFGIQRNHVHFADTRSNKVNMIGELGITHFIDDLPEIFAEPEFPDSVKKIYYAPETDSHPLPDITLCRSWNEIRDALFPPTIDRKIIERLAEAEVFVFSPLNGGGNSRVCQVETVDGDRYAAKQYYGLTSDGRDRMSIEFNALSFLQKSGVANIATPVSADSASSVALYEYVDGTKVEPADIDKSCIDQAVDFLATLEQLKNRPNAKSIEPASEACFSLAAAVKNIETRMMRLEATPDGNNEFNTLHQFLAQDFRPALKEVTGWSRNVAAAKQISFDKEITHSQKTLSPSDFGFHNSLRLPDGRLVWLDFEYFGWDDPAKMICDFLWHPAMGLNDTLQNRFNDRMVTAFSHMPELSARITAARPLYGLKWVMILLNEFNHDDLLRRQFAGVGQQNDMETRLAQLDKAQSMLTRSLNFCKEPY